VTTDVDLLTSAPASTTVNGILRPSRHPVFVVVIAVLGAALVTATGLVLRAHHLDQALSHALNELHTGAIGMATTFAYKGIGPLPAIVLTVIVTGVIWLVTRKIPVAAAFAGVVAVTWLSSDVVKILVHRVRPDGHLLTYPFTPAQLDASYPSGHVVFVTTFVVALAFVLRDTPWMSVWIAAGSLAIVGIALAVSIDAVHYPTDAAGSVLWGLTVTPGVRVVLVDGVMPRVPFLRA
jgi:undecaprenyl-diphosphatase